MSYSRLTSGTGSFSDMMKNGFGVVTVMTDVMVFDYDTVKSYIENQTIETVITNLKNQTPKCTLDTLKIANITIEGPSKTITGGQEASPIVKYGKTARIEMQDALGKADAIDYLGGAIVEYDVVSKTNLTSVHIGRDFNAPVTLLGKTFFVNKNGEQINVYIVIYKMLPDSVFNLAQDAEGDATVFDLNGDLLVAPITVGDSAGTGTVSHKEFYGIAPGSADGNPYFTYNSTTGALTLKTGYTGTHDGENISGTITITAGTAELIVISQSSNVVFKTTIIR